MKFGVLPVSLLALVALCVPAAAFPHLSSFQEPEDEWNKEQTPLPLPPPRPLVIWHGLGDQYMSSGMVEFVELIKDMHPGIFVYSVRISDEPSSDQRAGWFGNVNEQLEQVATEISELPELSKGFDAIGFSQAGQFLRAYAQRYNNAGPPIKNLMTFGSQHMGISDLPGCKPTDFMCRAAKAATRNGVYTAWAQRNLVQAQYYRDPANYATYLNHSLFLADINNEVDVESRRERNTTYAKNLGTLENFVMVLFNEDKTVIPKESSWFGSYSIPTEEDDGPPAIVHMKQQPLYKEDWIGLRKLDEEDKVFLIVCQGQHMQISDECWRPIVKRWAGSVDIEQSSTRTPEIPALLLQDR